MPQAFAGKGLVSGKIKVHVVDAFVDAGKGGNPAGVALDSDGLSKQAKQAIAATMGLSETAFVSRSEVADFKVEFFTPTLQVPHCGHATVATFHLLKSLGKISSDVSSKETVDGARRIRFSDDMVFLEQRAPAYRSISAAQKARVLETLGISAITLIHELEPVVATTANAYLILPLASRAALAWLKPDFHGIGRLCEDLDVTGYYVFTSQAEAPGAQAAARMFAPHCGINEESATGTAAGPLACYLRDIAGMNQTEFLIEQGRLMPRPSPSQLTARLEVLRDDIRRVWVGGSGRIQGHREISLQ